MSSIITDILSDIKSRIHQLFGTYGWRGDYLDWQSASKKCKGYNETNILEKVKEATLKVKSGEAVYERDSVLFDEVQYSWPLLATLLWVALQKNGRLHVADFGGALGSSYFQNRNFLSNLTELKWSILEQKQFVESGREYVQDDVLQFFFNLKELTQSRGKPDLLLLSCTLPYLETPYGLIENLMEHKIPYIFIDNTYFNYAQRDRICIQSVPPEIYEASYPCWLLDYAKLRNLVANRYTIVSEHHNESHIYIDGKHINYKGFLGKIKA
ncbi:MAG: methyltransferase, TIGR04325 family [Chitinophagales bacterium]